MKYSILIFGFILIILNCSCTTFYKTNKHLQKEKIIIKNKSKKYTFILSPTKKHKQGYSQLQIENFLCLLNPKYILTKDVVYDRYNYTNHLYIESKNINKIDLDILSESEVNKWFEPEVIVTCKGQYKEKDLLIIKNFFTIVNNIIGRQKFIFKKNILVANINIEFLDSKPYSTLETTLGYTIRLTDNLKTFFSKVNNKIYIKSYFIYYGGIIRNTKMVELSSEELSFMKKNRLVKVHIYNILRSRIRKRVLLHELLHAIGFNGHSPYQKCRLFPVLNPYGPALSRLDHNMIEILYRPEILPAMSFKDVIKILPHLDILKKTKNKSTRVFLKKRKKSLELEKKQLLIKVNLYFARNKQVYKDNRHKERTLNRVRQIIRQIKTIDQEIKLLAQ